MKKKADKPKLAEEKEEYKLPDDGIELDELIERLWYEFFTPAEPNSMQQKREILELYNKAVNKSNKTVGLQRHVNLTLSTQWKPSEKDSGPDITKKIFVDIIKFEKKKQSIAGVNTVNRHLQKNLERQPAVQSATAKPRAVKKAGEGGGIIDQIIAHHVAGKSNKEIIALGFNKSTVGRQVGEYKKRQQQGGK